MAKTKSDRLTRQWARVYFLMAIEEVAPQILQELSARPPLGPWLRSHRLDRPWIEGAVRRTWSWWETHPEDRGRHWLYSSYRVERPGVSDVFRFEYECKRLMSIRLTKQELKRSIIKACSAEAQIFVDRVFEYRRRFHKDSGLGLMPVLSRDREEHFKWLVYARVLRLKASQIRQRYARNVGSDEGT